MQLKQLFMSRSWDKNQMSGEAEFESDLGKVTVKLDEAKCHDILKICADGLVSHTQKVAAEMTAQVVQIAQQQIKE